MPLSPREKKILADIESDLTRDDPEFARRMGASELDEEVSSSRMAVIGLVVFIVCVLLPLLLATLTATSTCVTTPSSRTSAEATPAAPADRTPAPPHGGRSGDTDRVVCR